MILCLPETHPAERQWWCAALSELARRSASLSCTTHSGVHIIITETSHRRNRNQPSWEQKPVIVGNRNQSLWEHEPVIMEQEPSLWEQEPVSRGTGTSHYGNRNQSPRAQGPVIMGTGTSHYGTRTSHYGNRNQSAELMKTTNQQRNRNQSLWEQDPVTTGTGTSHYGNRNQALWEQEPVTTGTGTSHCGNRNQSLWEQEPVIMGTGTCNYHRNRNQSLIITRLNHHSDQLWKETLTRKTEHINKYPREKKK